MTSCLLSIALVLTPSPFTAPEEGPQWAIPAPLASAVGATTRETSWPSTVDLDVEIAKSATREWSTVESTTSTPITSLTTPPPPVILSPIATGLNHLSELGASPYQLRVFGCLAWYESKNDPYAVSATNDHGLWQINRRFHAWRSAGRDIYDPIVNAGIAWDIYRESGWRAWTTARLCGV